MNKSLLTILLLLTLALSACSQIQTYLPGEPTNNSSSNFDDTLNLTENEDDTPQEGVEIIDLTEDDDTTDVTEVDQPDEEVVEEPETQITLEVIEGETVSLSGLQAQDPDGDTIEFTYEDPLDEDGEWNTQDGDAGTYFVDVTASDGVLSTTETIKIVVNPSNKGPVIDCPTSLSAKEGDVVEIPCTIYDQEGDEVSYEVSGYANNFTFETGFDDAGSHSITVTATDGNRVTTKTIALTITNTNRAPVVEPMGDITVLEGETVTLTVDANDPDGDTLDYGYPLLFTSNGRWVTEKGDAGTYELEVEVTDGEKTVVVPVNIIVEKVNSAPTLILADTYEVDEGEEIDLAIEVNDVDGDGISVSISGFMTAQTYQTTYDDAGEYEVTVTATDGKKEVSKTAKIIINDVNRPPVFIFNK